LSPLPQLSACNITASGMQLRGDAQQQNDASEQQHDETALLYNSGYLPPTTLCNARFIELAKAFLKQLEGIIV
jgi:hypothetical protein